MIFQITIKALEELEEKIQHSVAYLNINNIQISILEFLNNKIAIVYNNLFRIEEILLNYYNQPSKYNKTSVSKQINGYLVDIGLTTNTNFNTLNLINGKYGNKDSDGNYIYFQVGNNNLGQKKVYLPNLTLKGLGLDNFNLEGEQNKTLEKLYNAIDKVVLYRTRNMEYFDQLSNQEDHRKWFDKYSSDIKEKIEKINLCQRNMLIYIKTNIYLVQNIIYDIKKVIQGQKHSLQQAETQDKKDLGIITKVNNLIVNLLVEEYDRLLKSATYNEISLFTEDKTLRFRNGNQPSDYFTLPLENYFSQTLNLVPDSYFFEREDSMDKYLQNIDLAINKLETFIQEIDNRQNIGRRQDKDTESLRTVLIFDYKNRLDIDYESINKKLNDEILMTKGFLLGLENISSYLTKLKEYALLMSNDGYSAIERNQYNEYLYNYLKNISDVTLESRYKSEAIFYKDNINFSSDGISDESIIKMYLNEKFVSDNFKDIVQEINFDTAESSHKSLKYIEELLNKVYEFKQKINTYKKRLQYRGLYLKINKISDKDEKIEEFFSLLNMILLEMRNSCLYSSSAYVNENDIELFNQRNISYFDELQYLVNNFQIEDKQLFKLSSNYELSYFYDDKYNQNEKYNFFKELMTNGNYSLEFFSFEEAVKILSKLDMVLIRFTSLKNVYIPLEYKEIRYR